MRSINSLFLIALFTLESFILVSSTSSSSNNNNNNNNKTVCLRRENDLFLKCPAPITDDFSASLFPSVINVLKQQQQHLQHTEHNEQKEQKEQQQRQNDRIEQEQPNKTEQQQQPSTVTKTSIVNQQQQQQQQQQTTPTPQRKPLVSFEEWQKKQVLVHENDYSRHNSKRKSNAASSNRQQMVDSVDGGFSDDFGSMFEGSNVHMDMPNAQDKIIEPNNNNKKATTSRAKFGDLRMKSLKERFNYASTDCAATVRKANKEAKGANAILYESKDQYLLNKCSADNKFVIINLCEPIRIDTIVMANYEFFSSTFKDFRIYVADRYPSKDWQLLGQWQARNTRDLQVFRVDDKSGWPEYIKIEFLSHYGHEYYCPLSLVRVYGMSMMEYYNRVERQGLSDDGDDENELEDEHLWPADVREQIIQPQFDIKTSSESLSGKQQSHDDEDDENDEILEEIVIKPVVPDSTDGSESKQNNNSNNSNNNNNNNNNNNSQHTAQHDEISKGNRNDNGREVESIKETRREEAQSASVKSIEYPEVDDNNMITTKEKTKTIVIDDPQASTFDDENKNQPVSIASPSPLPSSSVLEKSFAESSSSPSVSSTLSSSQIEVSQSTESKPLDHAQESDSSTFLSQRSESSVVSTDDKDSSSVVVSTTPEETSSVDPTSEETTTSPSSSFSVVNKDSTTSSESSSSSSSSPSPPPPTTTTTTTTVTTTNQEFEKSNTAMSSNSAEEVRQTSKIVVPKEKSTTQESIYKTIMKRLNALEVNATLSQRYLDEQNKMLNDVFIDMEKRHQEQLMMLIGHLNETASYKIDSMKRRYEKWYDDLKDQTENDMRDMTAKISILADQLSFERRVSLTQLVIIITIFVFMALSRGTFSTLSPVMAAREEDRKKRQSANQAAAALLSTISHSLKPKKNETPTKPENIRRHSDDPYFTMSLQEQRPRGLSTSSTASKKENQTLPDANNKTMEDDTALLALGISKKESYEGLNIELEPELLSHRLNDVLLMQQQQQQQPNEQAVPSSSSSSIQLNDNTLLSDEEEERK